MDDGTLIKYQKRIKELHPDILLLSSNTGDQKYELVRQQRYDEIRENYEDSAIFWCSCIKQDPGNFVFVLEDDTWCVNMFDLTFLEDIMQKNSMLFLKLFWGEQNQSGAAEVYHRISGLYERSIDLFQPAVQNLWDIWQIWLECMAIYSKEYYLNSYKGTRDGFNDEPHQLNQVAQYVSHLAQMKIPFSFAKTDERLVYQGWAATARSDSKYFKLGLVQHEFLDNLNESWYEGNFDVSEGYPFDYSMDYLISQFKTTISDKQIALWVDWRHGKLGEGYKNYYNQY